MRRALGAFGLGLALVLASAPASGAESTRPWLGWSTSTVDGIDATARALGVQPGAISAYAPFDEPFPSVWAESARQRGVPLVLAWEPWDWDRPPYLDQPEYALGAIADGNHDAYLRAWAQAAARSGVAIMLRFAPEMNGDWRPWSINDSPHDFVRAWRHVHDLFEQEGVTNVRWTFNPNVEYPGSVPIDRYWPGRGYVDWLGVDGYNWSGVTTGRTYESVREVFDSTITALRALAPALPLMIAECGAGPAAKARWIPDLIATAPALGVRLVVWFEHDKEADWRMSTAHLPQALPRLLDAARWRQAR